MAVHAEYATSSFEPDFFTRGFVEKTNQIDELPACTAILGYNNNNHSNNMINLKKLSSEETPQRSELTYNASASLIKKRARENTIMAFPYQLAGVPPSQNAHIQPFQFMGSVAHRPVKQQRVMDSGFSTMVGDSTFQQPFTLCGNAGVVGFQQMNTGLSTLRGSVIGLQCVDNARLLGSCTASTSGRPAVTGVGYTGIEHELASVFQQLSSDTDKIIQLEVERIQLVLEEERKAFERAILLELTKGPTMQWLIQKEAELEVSTGRNAELEKRLNQLSAEKDIWISIARNNESIVRKLQTRMEHSLKNALQEGMGDTDEVHLTCRDDVPVSQYACRVCQKTDAARLVVPCRHLCLCDGCDQEVSACPVCNQPKQTSIPVLFN